MNIYLAGRYIRREELAGYAAELEAMGHTVPARWLKGEHYLTPEMQEHANAFEAGERPEEAVTFALDDVEDVQSADMVISFTETPRSDASVSRGGRHVEFGLGYGWGKWQIVVGPVENVFHLLADQRFATWDEAKAYLAASKGKG